MIEISGLNYSLHGKPVLRNISLTGNEGEILGIIGPSGSGKSALLKIAGGVEKSYDGTILARERDIKKMSAREKNEALCLFTGEKPQNRDDSVENFILLSRVPLKRSLSPITDKDRSIAEKYISSLELEHCRYDRIGELCQSVQTLALLAHAFTREAGITLLDEPTQFLDLKSLALLHRTLAKKSSEGGGTIFICSNDINFILQCADRIIILYQGAVAEEGNVSIVTDDLIQKYFGIRVILSKNIYNGKPVVHYFPEN
ncbi:MAG TPA: ABC transporter ATP-binding protein [Spirochaetota bacterium]|nr:ABC transporter ATP-binding protein [Spirochaetota bacterium]